MVHVASFLGALLFAGVATALPRPDSSINEPAVAAPDGIKVTLTGSAKSTASSSGSYPAATSSAESSSSSSSSVSQYTQSSSSSYGGSSNSYGGSSNSYGGSNSYGSSQDSSWSYSYSWAAPPQQTSKSYGSGYNNWGWGGSDYNSCVQQCVAQYGAPPSTYTPPPSSSSDSKSGSKTHTIIVAPTQGVKRFIPPMMSVPPGDTVNFVWRANNHTVTKSSQLLPCNKTADHAFASGEQNMGFQFQETVNDTNPVFYYCGTPGHCEAGMWGVLNPTTSNSTDSVANMMPQMISNDSSLSAMWAYTSQVGKQYNASDAVMNWGGKYNVSAVPSWAQGELMQNIMFTRMFLAMNPETLQSDGSIDMSGSKAPLSFPSDISGALAGNNAASSTPDVGSSSAASSQAAATSNSASASPTGAAANGARGTAASSVFLGAAVLAVSFLAL